MNKTTLTEENRLFDGAHSIGRKLFLFTCDTSTYQLACTWELLSGKFRHNKHLQRTQNNHRISLNMEKKYLCIYKGE